MSDLGLGVMMAALKGNRETVEAHNEAMGKRIKSIDFGGHDPKSDAKEEYEDGANRLDIHFTDGTGIRFTDDGQSCCEERYMTCDDDVTAFVGAVFVEAEIREGNEVITEYSDTHEQEFLVINTSLGSFTVANHNEHNGYYGGFSIIVRSIEYETKTEGHNE